MTDAKTVTPEECHKCGAPKRNYQEHGYPYWQFYECGAKHSLALGEWSYGDTASCLRRQLAASLARVEALRLAADFKRNVIIHDDPKFLGRWIAVPGRDFMALREVLAALAAGETAQEPDRGGG